MGVVTIASGVFMGNENFRRLEGGRLWRETLLESTLYAIILGFIVGLLLAVVGPRVRRMTETYSRSNRTGREL